MGENGEQCEMDEEQHPFARLRRVVVGQYTEFAAALQFLSVLSVPGSWQLFDKDEVTSGLIIGCEYFPLVGLLLASLLWLLVLILAPLVPPLVLAALLVAALVILTGGLHLDGLMDSCDGLFGGSTRERKLEIMRDSRVGSFGVLGAICIVLLKFALFASLRAGVLPLALLTTLPAARWAMVLALRIFPSARPTGLGAAFHQAVTTKRLLLTAIVTLAIVLVAGQFLGLIVWTTVTVVALILGIGITRSIGGLTGDSYGAIEEVAEVMALLVLVMVRI
jgi:adenosylcobinamide-GDP ribazoletransferase